jgi:hypothetical protein
VVNVIMLVGGQAQRLEPVVSFGVIAT